MVSNALSNSPQSFCRRDEGSKTRKQLARILAIWKQRRLFGSEVVEAISTSMKHKAVTSKAAIDPEELAKPVDVSSSNFIFAATCSSSCKHVFLSRSCFSESAMIWPSVQRSALTRDLSQFERAFATTRHLHEVVKALPRDIYKSDRISALDGESGGL